MGNQEKMREIIGRLTNSRAKLLKKYPFLGRLLLHLPFGLTSCETAYTDMRKIVFDPEFASRLTEEELEFVLCHEIMHCTLKHCIRGKGLRRLLYNVACDIVVNSMIMEIKGISEYTLDGCKVEHHTPDGKEGREYSAEEIYYMLLKAPPEVIEERYKDSGFDTHIIWEQILDAGLGDEWEQKIRAAAKACGEGSGIPGELKRYLVDVEHTPKTNWRQILHDFIQHDKSDYLFSVPDKRYSGDILMPSFQDNVDGTKVDKLWFAVDTSGSISDTALSEVYGEIKSATEQIGNLSGAISFFDTEVSEPTPFESVKDLEEIEPVGGGGTSFLVIFDSLEKHFKDDLPNMIIIATDGYAGFPTEDAALDIPVVWLIIDSDVKPPWGECVYITTCE